ncbi:hypothetical protein R1sor_026627 [Riccia sorocarpa]|uniref:F-box domain-containing protein n=1 Tax=Riccia sorocarpa TaxID=122646 RepID=A0ABD3GE00_9MARC
MACRSPLSGELSQLSVEEDYRGEEPRFDWSTDDMLHEADFMDELSPQQINSGEKVGDLLYVAEQRGEEDKEATCTDSSAGPPDGFSFIFPYLDLKSLLTLERVSKSMRSGVNDILVWSRLLVEPPLSRNLTNEILFSLVTRAGGTLQFLGLVDFFRLTDEALAHVLSLSPRLEKLFIPGCTGLTAESVVNLVQQHAEEARAKGRTGIKQLRIRGIYNVTEHHLETLRTVLLSSNAGKIMPTKPLYWHTCSTYLLEDVRAIDVEICPRCRNQWPTVVYDCPKESCQQLVRLQPNKACRGCIVCIPRCVGCGSCQPREAEWEKTCCADMVCLTCWLDLPKFYHLQAGIPGRQAEFAALSPALS